MKKIYLMMLFLMFTGWAFAEDIELTSGMTIKGTVLERSGNKIKVNASGLDVTYYADQIRSIDGKPFEQAVTVEKKALQETVVQKVDKVSPPQVPKEAAASAVKEEPSVTLDNPASQTTTTSSVVSSQSNYSTSTQTYSSKRMRAQKLDPAKLMMVGMITLVIVGAIFILACYPVYLIAKKTNASYAYFAFIPILNYYLLVKIAGRPVWWMILYFVPLVGLVIDVIVWMDVAKVRNKPNWLGVLILVPLANLCMMWYLALTDQ